MSKVRERFVDMGKFKGGLRLRDGQQCNSKDNDNIFFTDVIT